MIAQPIQTQSAFSEYVARLLELHHLIAAGKGDADEAEDVRDRMDAPWRRLTKVELELVDGLSADLYTIGQQRPAPPAVDADIASATDVAFEEQRWGDLLDLLREHEKELPPDGVAFVRGICWFELQQFDVAIEFLREATRLNPGEPAYRYCLQILLKTHHGENGESNLDELRGSHAISTLFSKAMA